MHATITRQGQVTIPPNVRKALHLNEGDRVDFVIEAGGTVRLVPVTASITELKGMLPPAERTLSLEEMDDAIALGASGK
ncbi:MAG: type II toxin-antitoxin system PrlF family antitoxin [Proteobacteria bacterium]|nr:type II toxin-antitoxin system PrlF family antitoxin [Pseudomonadota bacterium]